MTQARHNRVILGLVSALAMLAAIPGSAPAQQTELNELERALREDRARAEELKRRADNLAQEIQALRVESVAIARKAQDRETDMSALEMHLVDLERQEREKLEMLATRRIQLGRTLAALQRIAMEPSNALLLSPGLPVDTLRSGLLLRAAIPAIESRAATLRGELDELQALRVQIATRRDQLSATAEALAADRQRLQSLIARKSKTRAAATAGQKAAQENAARLAARAENLRDLLEKLEREAAENSAREAKERAAKEQAARELAARAAAERAAKEQAAKVQAAESAREAERRAAQERAAASAQPQAPSREPAPGTQVALARPPNIRPFPSSGQSLVMPARGRMKFHFGQVQGDGHASRGIVIAARNGAQVVAPFDGKVVYAGVFRTYGQILIIEHGGRYHTLLAGLERVDAVVGQWLLAGEPVGILGSPRGSGPELYLELRHAGQPINPLPWLATTGDKVRG